MLLWGEARCGSVTELAKLAAVGFASAHRELNEMKRYELARSDNVDGVEVFSANTAHPSAGLLRDLATSRPRTAPPRDSESEALRGRLRALGVPLSVPAAEVATGDEAATLAAGVQLARRDPVLARALPLGFWHQRDQLDGEAVAAAARRAGEKQAVGFLLELTSELSGDPRFTKWASRLKDRRVRAEREFFELPSTSVSAERKSLPQMEAARKWKFRLNADIDLFRSQFEKFAHVA